MSDDFGAFVPGQRFRIAGKPGGPLSGLTFAAKDLFDVVGHPTGGGNPDWPHDRPIPTRHAWAVQTLLDAGADLIGKTITDEVSLGILGETIPDELPKRLVVATDAFAFAEPDTAAALEPIVDRLRALVGDARDEAMAPAGLATWARAQRTIQPHEAWRTFAEWLDRTN